MCRLFSGKWQKKGKRSELCFLLHHLLKYHIQMKLKFDHHYLKCDFFVLVCCLFIDWLQGGGDLVHVLSGNKLLLDPCWGTVPPQPHLYDLFLGQKVSMGIYSDWMGWVLLHLHSMHMVTIWLVDLIYCQLSKVFNFMWAKFEKHGRHC